MQPRWLGRADYAPTFDAMRDFTEARDEATPDELWICEHPPVYTAGTTSVAHEVLDERFEVIDTGRGGRHTYHGPGQRVGYVLLDLNHRGRDVRRFVHSLEEWVIATLGDFGVEAWSVPDRIGIWTRDIDDGVRRGSRGNIARLRSSVSADVHPERDADRMRIRVQRHHRC